MVSERREKEVKKRREEKIKKCETKNATNRGSGNVHCATAADERGKLFQKAGTKMPIREEKHAGK